MHVLTIWDDIAAAVAVLGAGKPATSLQVVCLPGFGDSVVGERWVTELRDALCGTADVEAWDWPGLWTRWSEPVSFLALVEAVREAAGPRTVFVGHSLGGRVALQVARSAPVAGVVAICSPTKLGLNGGAGASSWIARGTRATSRTAPNGMAVSYELPVVFLHELNTWLQDAAVPPCPTLLVFGDQDPKAAAGDWEAAPRLGADPAVVTATGCPHRFMDSARARREVVGAIDRFVRSLPRP